MRFDLYLRAGEAVSLSWEQVTPPAPRTKPRLWAVRVAPSGGHAEGSMSDMDPALRDLGRRLPSKMGPSIRQFLLVRRPPFKQAGASSRGFSKKGGGGAETNT